MAGKHSRNKSHEMAQVAKILPHGRQWPVCHAQWIPCLLMIWECKKPGHRQPYGIDLVSPVFHYQSFHYGLNIMLVWWIFVSKRSPDKEAMWPQPESRWFCVLTWCLVPTLIARFMGTTWGPPGDDRTQVGPMLAPWTLLSGNTLCCSVCSSADWLHFTTATIHPHW